MATTLKDILGQILGKKGEAVRELSISIRTQGKLTEREDTMLRACMIFSNLSHALMSSVNGFTIYFAAGQVHKLVGGRPVPRLLKIGAGAGAGLIAGQMMYYRTLHTCTLYIFNSGEERLKTELATIILTKHSGEKSSVEAVRKHYYAEQLYSDQNQDKLCFMWIPRSSYVDSAFMERVKEIEASNSADKAKTISGETTRSFGDLMEDPLACILGSSDSSSENDDPPKRTTTILRRTDLRARRRRHWRHHRHATL
uniref:Uncharacterized protein n=1 Tax=Avena sativa TaxID=4498 RepID=A0ACD5ZN50_AVESA